MNLFHFAITEDQKQAWTNEFRQRVGTGSHMTGEVARATFTQPSRRVTQSDLAQIWELADQDKDTKLSLNEFLCANFLIFAREQGILLPKALPQSLIDSINRVSKKESSSKTNKPMWTVSEENFKRYHQIFRENSQPPTYSFVSATTVLSLFSKSGIQFPTLSKIWHLADKNHDNILVLEEFVVALHLLSHVLKGNELPESVPQETLNCVSNLVAHKPEPSRAQPVKQNIQPPASPFQPVTSHRKVPSYTAPPFQGFPPSVPAPQPCPSPTSNRVHGHTRFPSSGSFGSLNPIAPTTQPGPSQPSQPAPLKNPFAPPPVNPFTNQVQPPLNISKFLGQFQFQPPKEPDLPPPPSPVPDYEKDLNGVQKLDPKDIHREVIIGTGVFSTVWKGRYSNEIVAIKDVNYHNEREIEMWRREVQILGLLQGSEYLVNITGYSVTPEFLSIVMEFMEQGSLFDIIHKKRNVIWSMLQKIHLLKHLALGLQTLHKFQVVHRDIKSMNVLVDARSLVKLADLGCSRILGPRSETMTIGIGTPLWMAPEILTGSYSYPADIFGLGVIVYEVLNEKLPDYDSAKKRVIIPPEAVGYSLIKECIKKNPNHRPTATQLIESMDLLIRSFTTSVAHIVVRSCSDPAGLAALPPEEDVQSWYKLLLSYDRNTFDVLLSKALSTL